MKSLKELFEDSATKFDYIRRRVSQIRAKLLIENAVCLMDSEIDRCLKNCDYGTTKSFAKLARNEGILTL